MQLLSSASQLGDEFFEHRSVGCELEHQRLEQEGCCVLPRSDSLVALRGKESKYIAVLIWIGNQLQIDSLRVELAQNN